MINANEAKELSNGVKRFALVLAKELEKLDMGIKSRAEHGERTMCVVYYTPNPLLRDFDVLINTCEELGYEVHVTYEKSYDGSLTSARLSLNW